MYFDYIKDKRLTKPFSYKVEGIGEDFFPSTINMSIIDDVVRVDDKECFLMTRDLVRLEGLFVGGSCGAAVAGAIKYARQSGKKENILVLLPDGASKYISKIFNDDWMRENGFLDDQPGLGTVKDLLAMKGGAQKIETATSNDTVRGVVASFMSIEEKLVEVDPQNKEAWYSLGVITWAKWYPELMAARTKRGMKPEDPGPLKDPKVRVELREKYGDMIEGGFE